MPLLSFTVDRSGTRYLLKQHVLRSVDILRFSFLNCTLSELDLLFISFLSIRMYLNTFHKNTKLFVSIHNKELSNKKGMKFKIIKMLACFDQ